MQRSTYIHRNIDRCRSKNSRSRKYNHHNRGCHYYLSTFPSMPPIAILAFHNFVGEFEQAKFIFIIIL